MDTAAMDWQASPSPTVWRKRLDLVDGEFSRVTSIVRYDPSSSFRAHGHPQGEEILVLDGVFSDEHGDYPAGTFLLNPAGVRHAPSSEEHTSELQSLMRLSYAAFRLQKKNNS